MPESPDLLAGAVLEPVLVAAMGALAGCAFPLALLARRAWRAGGDGLDPALRMRRHAFFASLVAGALTLPWLALGLVRWIDAGRVPPAHGLILVLTSLTVTVILLRRWRLHRAA
jgi:hypothetical protein